MKTVTKLEPVLQVEPETYALPEVIRLPHKLPELLRARTSKPASEVPEGWDLDIEGMYRAKRWNCESGD
jgi:hypothetical protein